MRKKFSILFLIIFIIPIVGGLITTTSFAKTVIAARNYYFDDNQRMVEYPRGCAGECGRNLITIQVVRNAYPKERDVTVATPRGAYPKKSESVVSIFQSRATENKGFFTELKDEKGIMDLYFVSYDPDEIDFYYEKEEGKLDNTSFYIETTKYRIKQLLPQEKDSAYIQNCLIDRSNENGSYPFLVCSSCAKCNTCNHGYSASNGFSIPPARGSEKDTSKLVVGRYCKDHTCAFIWNVNNGNFNVNTVEGIDCKAKALDNSLFCEEHTCKDSLCNKPVIGWNTTDSRSTKLRIYQGPDKNQYSNYCVDHFCKHYTCKDARRSVTSSTAVFSGDKYINFPEYCPAHGNDCTIYGCDKPVIKMHTDEKDGAAVYICEYHADHYEELQKQAIELGLEDANRTSESDVVKDYCSNCKKYLVREVKSTGETFGKVIDGRWYCSICSAQNFTVRETVNDFGDKSNEFTYHTTVPASQYADPATCIHSNYPIPNTVKFINITKETHTQVWTCINCNTEQRVTYNHPFENGVCVCGYKKGGDIPPEEKEDEEDKNDTDYMKPLVEIANAKYVMPYSKEAAYGGLMTEEIILVQLQDRDSVQLKIQKDKLSVLTYRWEGDGNIVGYADGYEKEGRQIPSSDIVTIPSSSLRISDYVLEKPDYVLSIEYKPKDGGKTEIVKYQIYLP